MYVSIGNLKITEIQILIFIKTIDRECTTQFITNLPHKLSGNQISSAYKHSKNVVVTLEDTYMI